MSQLNGDRAPGWLRALGGLGLLVGIAVLVQPALHAAFHCDETNIFRHVTRFASGHFGTPGRPGLMWLMLVPTLWLGDPVTSAMAMRIVSVLASTLTLLLVWRLAARGRGDEPTIDLAGGWGGLAAVVLLLTSFDWQGHAFEIRTDTLVVPMTLGAMALLWKPDPRLRALVFGAVLLAAAGLVSQKSVYNAVAIGGAWAVYLLVCARPLKPGKRFAHAGIVAGVVLVVMALWFVVMGLLSGKLGQVAEHTVRSGMVTAFDTDIGFDRKLKNFTRSFDRGPVIWVLAVLALPASAFLARRRPRAFAALIVGALMASTIWIHRGFRTYYVASMEPYLAIGVGSVLGVGLAWLHRHAHAVVAFAVLAVIAGVGLKFGLPHQKLLLATSNEQQIKLIHEIEAAFPEPVPYWDAVNLVPGYPESTFLGTGQTRKGMRKNRGNDGFRQIANERKPQFFLRTYMTRDTYLRGPELRWHWRHFLPYRTNLYLAGGRILIKAPERRVRGAIEPWNDGEYTVWFKGGWSGDARVDGRRVKHGEVIELAAGEHQLEARSSDKAGELWLLLGRDRVPEDKAASRHVDFSMFPLDERARFQQYDRKGHKADLLTQRSDPTMTKARHKTRSKRHRSYQKKRHERLATP